MKRSVERTDRGQATLFPECPAVQTGSTRTTRFKRSTSLSMNSMWRGWDLTGSHRSRPGGLRILFRFC